MATIWKDKKHVKVLSNIHKGDMTSKVKRRLGDGSQVEVDCPMAVTEHNKYMGGVDKSDQLRGYYHVRLKSSKKNKCIFWFMFDVAITNAFILSQYSPTCSTKTSQTNKQFRLTLAKQLIDGYNTRKQPGRPRSSILPQRPHLNPKHFPSHNSLRKKCVYCKQYRYPPKRTDTIWFCEDCPGTPALCLTGTNDGSNCYKLWHELP